MNGPRCLIAALAIGATAAVLAACDPGVPMGGRDVEGDPPNSVVACDPDGVRAFQPEECR